MPPEILPSCRPAILPFMDLGLAGKIAIVTGSSKGLGLASARALAQEGCQVTICARGEASLEEAAADLRRIAQRAADVLPVVADVSTASNARSRRPPPGARFRATRFLCPGGTS